MSGDVTENATEATERKQPRWIGWALAAVVVACLAIRVWNLSAGLDSSRFFDERFSLRNVSNLLVEGTSRPANAFYGSLSYLPQTAVLWLSQELHELTGVGWLAVFDERAPDGWSKTAYFLCRLVCAIFGTLSVWVTFLVGRRLFSPRVGLLGAALLTAFPRHVLSSTEFKPDILVTLLVALTFLWSIELVRSPTTGRFVKAGAGVGLAVAAKYTGVGAAIPLAVGTLFARWRDRRQWLGLVAAGVASVVVFFLLNPHVAVIFRFLPRIWSIMESKGEATGGSHFDVLLLELRYLYDHHQPVVFAFVVAGCVGVAARLFRSGVERRQRVEAAMVLSYLFGYSALYAAATKLFKGQNYLPVAVFTSLLAAWAMVALWDRLAAKWPLLHRPAAALPAWGLALALVYAEPVSIIYHDVVPSTREQVQDLLRRRLRHLELRHVFYENRYGDGELRLRVTSRGHWLPAIPTERLDERPEAELDLGDAEVFAADRLSGDSEDPAFYLRRGARSEVRAERFDPAFFRAHGEPMVVLLHPWQAAGEPAELTLEPAGKNRYRSHLDDPLVPGETISLALWLPLHTGAGRPRWVAVDGHRLTLHRTRRGGKRAHYTTGRVTVPAGTDRPEIELRFELALHFPFDPEVTLHRWRPEGSP